jgi:hypothetical protein
MEIKSGFIFRICHVALNWLAIIHN